MSSHGTIRVLQGDSGSTTVTTALSRGTPQSLSLYCVASTLPKDASCSFSPSSVTPNGSSVVTVTTASATPTGSFQVQVTGSPLGTTTIPTVFTLTVNPSVLGLDPNLFYAIVGGIIAVTVIIALSAHPMECISRSRTCCPQHRRIPEGSMSDGGSFESSASMAS